VLSWPGTKICAPILSGPYVGADGLTAGNDGFSAATGSLGSSPAGPGEACALALDRLMLDELVSDGLDDQGVGELAAHRDPARRPK
jgi:hypothetical protein